MTTVPGPPSSATYTRSTVNSFSGHAESSGEIGKAGGGGSKSLSAKDVRDVTGAGEEGLDGPVEWIRGESL